MINTMWAKRQQIRTQEDAMGQRRMKDRRLFNQQLLRLEGGSASIYEFVDNVLDDVVTAKLRAGGNTIPDMEVQRAKKETKWLLTLMYDVFRDTYVYMTKAGETIVLTKEATKLHGGQQKKKRPRRKPPLKVEHCVHLPRPFSITSISRRSCS